MGTRSVTYKDVQNLKVVKIQWPYQEVHIGKQWETEFKSKDHVQDLRNQTDVGLHPLQPDDTLELTEEFLQISRLTPRDFDLVDLGWGPGFKSTTVGNEPLKAK